MKILTVIPGNSEGYSMIFAKKQVLSIEKKGIRNHVFYLTSRTNLYKLIWLWIKFQKILNTYKPDIIHCHYGTMTAFFCVLSTFRPLIITFHGSDINKTPKDKYFRNLGGRILSHISIIRANAIICVSESVKTRLWFGKNKAYVIPIGIDLEEFYPIPREVAREKLNWDKEEKVVIFNRNNPTIKRLDIAEKTIRIAKEQIPNLKLLIIKGEVKPEEMPLYLNASNCVLVCSESEGGPMIVKEALSCNIPIVSVDVGDVAERLKGVDCSIITLKDPQSLARSLVKILISDKQSNGREKIISDHLAQNITTDKVISIYNKILR